MTQLISFQIADKLLGVDIMAVREIRAWTPTTKIPHAPSFVNGVVNLRGTVVPVIDLSQRLGWEVSEASPRHVIIVVQIGAQLNGLIVDSVNDIVTIDLRGMQPLPELCEHAAQKFLKGLVTVGETMVTVLDLDALALVPELLDAVAVTREGEVVPASEASLEVLPHAEAA